jgi:hypothetical protein
VDLLAWLRGIAGFSLDRCWTDAARTLFLVENVSYPFFCLVHEVGRGHGGLVTVFIVVFLEAMSFLR